jgi:hypothetical protein
VIEAVVVVGILGAWLASGIWHEALYGSKLSSALGKPAVHPNSILGVIDEFNNDKSDLDKPSQLWAFVVGCLLFSLPALVGIWRDLIRSGKPRIDNEAPKPDVREAAFCILLCIAVPILLVFAAGREVRFYYPRYLAFCAAPYYVMAARGLLSIGFRPLQWLAITAAVFFSFQALRANYFVPYKENFRDPIAYMAGRSSPGDCHVVEPAPGLWGIPDDVRWAWSLYQPSQPPLSIDPLGSLNEAKCQRLWLITDFSAYADPAPSIRILENTLARDFQQVDRQSYFRVEITLYQRKRQ